MVLALALIAGLALSAESDSWADSYTEELQRDLAKAHPITTAFHGARTPFNVLMQGAPSNVACNGLLAGMTDGLRQACCPRECGSCDDYGCKKRGPGMEFCCPSKILLEAPSCERKEKMKNRNHPNDRGKTYGINNPPCVVEAEDGYTKDPQGYLRKAMYSARGVFMGYNYKEPPQPKNPTAAEREAIKNGMGFWDTADGVFRHHGDVATWHRKMGQRTVETTNGDIMQAHTGAQVRLTPLNDKRPVCKRIPCKTGEVMIARSYDGLPTFYKTSTPYGPMYMTTGPKDHVGDVTRPHFDRWGRYMPPMNVEYSIKPTTQCCKATCAQPKVIAEAKKSDKHIAMLSDKDAETGCGYGCGMWLHSSSLNWESTSWHAALRDRCIRDCEMPRAWKDHVHFAWGKYRKDKLAQQKKENSPWLQHPLAINGTYAQEQMCKKGCQYYYMCIGATDVTGTGAKGKTWATAKQTPAGKRKPRFSMAEAQEIRFMPLCKVSKGAKTCLHFTDANVPLCHILTRDPEDTVSDVGAQGSKCRCPENSPRCTFGVNHGMDESGNKITLADVLKKTSL